MSYRPGAIPKYFVTAGNCRPLAPPCPSDPGGNVCARSGPAQALVPAGARHRSKPALGASGVQSAMRMKVWGVDGPASISLSVAVASIAPPSSPPSLMGVVAGVAWTTITAASAAAASAGAGAGAVAVLLVPQPRAEKAVLARASARRRRVIIRESFVRRDHVA